MSESRHTIETIKERREARPEARERAKKFAKAKKAILSALEGEELTVSEIASRTGMAPEEATYWLMTMRKFEMVEAVDDDDVDDYYSYRIKG